MKEEEAFNPSHAGARALRSTSRGPSSKRRHPPSATAGRAVEARSFKRSGGCPKRLTAALVYADIWRRRGPEYHSSF
jgi:hypothetical protein